MNFSKNWSLGALEDDMTTWICQENNSKQKQEIFCVKRLKKGVKGDSVYVRNANKAGKLTITLQQESPDIAFLEKCAESFKLANLAITDANDGGSQLFAQNVAVEKLPDRARGKDAADVTIVFLIPDINL